MQKLILVTSNNTKVMETSFDTDKEARMAMKTSKIAPNYKFEMENELESNICIADFLEKILKQARYEEVDNLREFLTDKIETTERFTESEKNRISMLVDVLYPLGL